MPELVHFDVHPQEVEGFPVLLYHRTKGVRSVSNRDEERAALVEGFSKTYQHQDLPKVMYHPDGRLKIVSTHAEQAELTAPWREQPFKKPIWDTRQPEPGYQINEHHLAFLKSQGYELADVEAAKAWFNALENPNAQFAFLEDATNWIPPEEKKRGPGRPPKAE